MRKDIVLLSGRQGSGKTTTAKALCAALQRGGKGHDASNFIFAGPLYEMHDECRFILSSYGIDTVHRVKDGNLLQMLGTDWARNTIDQDIWVKVMQNKIDTYFTKMDNAGFGRSTIVVSDCRFRNEFDGFPDALRVRLMCSEKERKVRTDMWRENTGHPSEVDLDGYDKAGNFDLYIDTEAWPSSGVVDLIKAQLDKNNWREKR